MLDFDNSATGGKDHTHNKYKQNEAPESSQARTITHCPPSPAPHSGKDITVAQTGRPIQTQNHNSHPTPPSSPESFLLLFSSALFFFVCLLSAPPPPPPLFFKLVYRTRREAACGKELSLLSFDDVISVVVPQRTFFLTRKKPAVSVSPYFVSLFVSSVFLLFFVNDNKKDLPLNVQDVFSHT